MDEGELMEMPRTSIIIPTYNSGGTLSRCLKSVCGQSYPFIEIIIVDNLSNDATVKIGLEFGAKIIQQKSTPALARNLGIANSVGKYVFFIDSDQALSSSVVEECVMKCENGEAGMVRVPEVFIGSGFWGCCSAAWKNCYKKVELYGTGENSFSGEPRFFDKDQIVHTGMLNSSLHWGEDYDLYKKMRKMGVNEASCKSKLYHYEPESTKGILQKFFRYGSSMPTFTRHTGERVLLLILKNSLITSEEICKEYTSSPVIVLGCAVLLCSKACAITLGLMKGLLARE